MLAPHVDFAEINLRFYVRLDGWRGVVLIREFASRPAIAVVARLTYDEPCRTIRMRDELLAGDGGRDGCAQPARGRVDRHLRPAGVSAPLR
ncbi:MAG: DUF2071 domain-containing protein [Thermoleophilia bacterium]